jgi:aminopeptidase N
VRRECFFLPPSFLLGEVLILDVINIFIFTITLAYTQPNLSTQNRYDIKLIPDLEAFTFQGEVTIELETSADLPEDSREIVMHAKELCFISASYSVKNSTAGTAAVEAEQICENKKATTVTLTFPSTTSIPASSTLLLTIKYIGFLNNQMAGFYRSSYTNIHGESKIMASTQFESLDARRAFPCWDEPARKAVFGVTLVTPSNLVAFSNMPEKTSKTLPGGKLRETTYLDSPKMSSYLLAFCVGEFDYVQAQTEHGVLVRVYTPPGKSDSGMFALDCAVKSLDAYDDFFGTPYPLPKLDMVAIPEFAMGAMEVSYYCTFIGFEHTDSE